MKNDPDNNIYGPRITGYYFHIKLKKKPVITMATACRRI